jgi:adenine phosphoribosyltransferase
MLTETLSKFEGRADAYLQDIDLRDFVTEYADFPKPGILFKDVSPMLASPEAMRVAAHEIALRCGDADIVVGLDARGFLFGMAAAKILEKPFVMARKKGKLPGETFSKEYGLEYGKDVIEIQKYAKIAGKKIAIVDDLLATGGTALAAAELVEKAGGIVDSVVFAISLDSPDLASMPGRLALASKYRIESLLSYE